MQVGFAWECSCGNVIYAEDQPEECNKCGALDSYLQMPEEVLKTREEELKDEEISQKVIKKVKTTKSTRKKK